MTMKKITIGLSLAALMVGGGAYAAQDQMRPDADAGRTITRAEAQQRAEAMFTRLDVNKDGKLDQTDRAARRQDMKARMFDRLDTNKDGQISRAEFMVERTANGDDARPGRGGHRGKNGGWSGHRGGMMRMARMADTNSDGAITKAEFTAAALQRFDAMDTNKDGQVTPEERQAAREQMRAKWQQMRAQRSQS
jgi:Ca2+-binding EF-hand superfamily protein